MPGPGAKKNKAKNKAKGVSASSPSAQARAGPSFTYPQNHLDNVYHAEGWGATVDALCIMLGIPDPNSRNGLKKIHKDFGAIHSKLDDVYAYARQLDRDNGFDAVVQDRLFGAVVALYGKMSADTILRDRIFKEADFLSKTLPLLDSPVLSHMVLQTLSAVTHHGGLYVRIEIAKKTSAILQLLDEQPNDVLAGRLGITIICHSLGAVVQQEECPDPLLLKAVDVPRIIRTILSYMRKGGQSQTLIDHGLGALAGATQHCSKDFAGIPSAINLLVACARSPDIRTRATGLGAILRLHISDGRPDDTNADVQKFISAASRQWPDHIVDHIMDYGMNRSDTFLMATAARDYQSLMMKAAQDHDLITLGLNLAQLIGRTEYSIAQGGFQVENPRTGKFEFADVGLPFKMWQDALPHCARAIRTRGRPDEADPADILDLKYYIMKSRMKEAHALARKSVERNPLIGFYHYVLSLGAEDADGLREAKKGLKCKVLTPYVRFGLLYRSAEHATELALRKLQDAMTTGQDLEEGFAFAMCALEDSKIFIDEAPPDARSMKSVIYIYTVMLLLVKGHELSPELHELDDAKAKLKLAEDIARFVGRPISETQMRLARATLVNRMSGAWKEWEDIVGKFVDHTEGDLSAAKAEDDLSSWLEDLGLEDRDAQGHRHDEDHFTHPRINLNQVLLYRCSWCGNPSAVLRKCRGCQKTRYCDADCQRQHWSKSHKKLCAKAA
ncbi:hypothetical protein FA95DRAFT_1552005 [Auriscalpium vulgare]|uniref:Uncharacterized protein n=1 Tax=Auriscalpium vulgare TaxID=40419 RepID=A0ACB8SDX9_9AGAM|nr:hypothetical protein FA95DRAFT_1552005 [Auriscalpium vulgare]